MLGERYEMGPALGIRVRSKPPTDTGTLGKMGEDLQNDPVGGSDGGGTWLSLSQGLPIGACVD